MNELVRSARLPLADDRYIRVRVFPDPIVGLHVDVQVAWGSTIAEIVAAIPLDAKHEVRRPYFAVRLGEHLVHRDKWHRVRPAAFAEHRPIQLVVYLPLHGGGSGNTGRKLLSIVAAIALIGVSLFAGAGGFAFLGGGLFQAGSLSAQLLAGAISIGGSLLLQGLFTPPKPGTDSTDALDYANAPNSFQPGQQLQRVLGTCKVSPAQVIPPFTTIDNGVTRADGTYRYSQYVTMVYALSGQHQIQTVYCGDVDASQMKDVEVEVRNGTSTDTHLTLVTDTRFEEQVGTELSGWLVDPDQTVDGQIPIDGTIAQASPLWHIVETRNNPDAFRIEYLMQNGLVHRDNNGAAALSIRLQLRYQTAGGWTAWADLGNFTFAAYEPNNALRMHLIVQWVDAYPANSGNAWPAASTWGARKGFVHLWTAGGSTEAGTGIAGWYYESEKRVYLYLLKSAWPQARYQIQMQRSLVYDTNNYNGANQYLAGLVNIWNPILTNGNLPYNPNHYANDVVVPTVQSIWNQYPIADDGEAVTLVAIRAKNRQINNVSLIASGLCHDWNGAAWVASQVTSNPASWYRHVLHASHNAEPVDETLIDYPALQDWHDWAAAQGHRIDTVIQGKSVIETLKMIALAGFAAPVFGAQFSIIPDRARSAPVGLITQRNASQFGFTRPFAPMVHALRVTYLDRSYLYKAREVIVFAPGYGAAAAPGIKLATRYEARTYDGITSLSEATARANLDLAWMIYRSTLRTFTMDIEHLEFRRGDLVMMQTDILGQINGSGRVKTIARDPTSGLITSITLDDEAKQSDYTDLNLVADMSQIMDVNAIEASIAAAVRLRDGSLVTLTGSAGASSKQIVLDSPTVMPTSPALGDLLVIGSLASTGPAAVQTREVLIWDIAPGQDMTADITAVDYRPDIFYP